MSFGNLPLIHQHLLLHRRNVKSYIQCGIFQVDIRTVVVVVFHSVSSLSLPICGGGACLVQIIIYFIRG